MKVKEIAHIRTGDKGNTCNICVIAYNESDFPFLKEKLTECAVQNFYKDFCKGKVIRYVVDSICGMNFVLTDALDGGVTKSLAVDKHGKTLGMALLDFDLSN